MKPDDKRLWEKFTDKDDRWRKKRKRKEDYQTIDSVIDQNTNEILVGLRNQGFIDSISGTIASGKESGVFLALLGARGEKRCQELSIQSPIVIKIFRTSTLNFRKIKRYISGDIRFKKHSKKTREIIKLWVEKEFRNLNRSHLAGVNVPKPILVKKNVLLMELIQSDGIPSPLLKNTPQKGDEKTLKIILEQIKLLYKNAGLVHGDLSAYNILMRNGDPVLIDMSQSILISHPKAKEFLKRDIENILVYFSGKGISTPDLEEVFQDITTLPEDESN
ncbi:MAG: serine protein kinase RIO [Candidatus Hodarchaeales archaeon]|jgi:RIO kinase 1